MQCYFLLNQEYTTPLKFNNLIWKRKCFVFLTQFLSPSSVKLEAAGCNRPRPDSEWFADNSFIPEGPISPPCRSELEVESEWDYLCSGHVCKAERPHFCLSDSGSVLYFFLFHYNSSVRHYCPWMQRYFEHKYFQDAESVVQYSIFFSSKITINMWQMN